MSRLADEILVAVFSLFFIACCMIIAIAIGGDWERVLLFAIVFKIMRPGVKGIFR